MSDEQHDDKALKKQAKAEAKAAKKQAKAEADAAAAEAEAARPREATDSDGSPAERSARAAERKVALESWRTIFAAVGALIGLATLLFMARQGCA
jgi:hypothetical protein